MTLHLHQYPEVHGIIESFGGRVKDFAQDLHDHEDWHIFYEMSKANERDFRKEMVTYFNGGKPIG
jgi:hypothetical protein